MNNFISVPGALRISSRCLKELFSATTFPAPPDDGAYQPTCVFLLILSPDNPHILTIQKSDRDGYPWRNQIALPGGHLDQEDPTALDAAFRELDEELGIPRDQVSVIGSMGHFQTIRQKDIQVFVGLWNGKGPVRHDTEEISRVLNIPLKDLIRTHVSHDAPGRPHDITYPFKDVVIWGVTAKILSYFIELIYPKIVEFAKGQAS